MVKRGSTHADSLSESFASTSSGIGSTTPDTSRSTSYTSSRASPGALQNATPTELTPSRLHSVPGGQSASSLQTRANSWQSWLLVNAHTMNAPPSAAVSAADAAFE